MELKITKEKVLEAASKCGAASETLRALFPEAFEPMPFEFGKTHVLDRTPHPDYPLYIGNAFAPKGLENKCLIVNAGWEMRATWYEDHQALTFHKRKQ